MAELKTKPTRKSVKRFLSGVENERRRSDALEVLALMEDVTGEKPVMWGDSLVGFGTYQYRYKSGHSGEWFLTGFSPRKQSLTIHIMSGFSRFQELLDKLGKHRTAKSCLYINRLEDIDIRVLRRLVKGSVERVKKWENSMA